MPAFFHNTITTLKRSFSFWPVLLVTFCLVIAAANFQPGVWLTGWDTLHPEFDFSLNITRMLNGAWREDQGLGAVAAHSHMSDLPRVLTLWLLSAVLPIESVKFIYVLGCLVLGPLGIYFFTAKSIFKGKKYASLLGFIAGLMYLCNLGTVQHFYVVFEMFAVQFAALGWLFWLGSEFITTGKRRTLIWFSTVTLLATPMAYAATLWFAFAAAFGMYTVLTSILYRNKAYFFRTCLLGVLLVLLNSFWLFPNLYLLFSGASHIPQNSHINELFSSEAFLHNQAYGTIQHLPILRNFLFNWSQYNAADNTYTPLLQPWIEHLQKPGILAIGYSLSLLSLFGFVLSFFKKNKLSMSLSVVGLFSLFMLINANPPFEALFMFLRSHSAVFEEGLRFPFTKFSLLFMLGFAVFVSQATAWFLEKLETIYENKQLLQITVGTVFITVLSLYFLPAFSGNVINHNMKRDIPEAYFSTFEWFKTQPAQARVAQLPLQTNTGWDYYTWGYEGPGFIWFGISQPLLVRDFDRWNPNNETFYNQASQALYNGTPDEFYAVLRTYDVHYLLLDKSITNPGGNEYALAHETIAAFLQTQSIPVAFTEDFITVYDLSGIYPDAKPAVVTQQAVPQTVAADTTYSRWLVPEEEAYITTEKPSVTYPFADIAAERPTSVTVAADTLTFERKLSLNPGEYILKLPKITQDQTLSTSFSVTYTDGVAVLQFPEPLRISIGEQQITHAFIEQEVSVPLTISPDNLAIGFGQQFVTVEKGTSTQPVILTLPASEELIIRYYDADTTTQNPEIFTQTVASTVWNSNFSEREVPVTITGTQQTLTLQFHSATLPLYLRDENATTNCSTEPDSVAYQTNTESGVTFSAQNKGAACTYIELPHLSLNDSFLMTLTGYNHTGRGLKVYLDTTYTNHSDSEHILPEDEFSESYTIPRHSYITPEDDFYDPYRLTLETRSFGARESKNELSNVTVSALPAKWLSAVQILSEDTTAFPDTKTNVNPLITRHSPVWYSIEVADSDEKLLTLSQSYDAGWLAFSDNRFWQPLPHYKYNGWANAWQIEETDTVITVIFWPQLLSFTGFGLALITVILLFARKTDFFPQTYTPKYFFGISMRATKQSLLGEK